MGSTQRVRSLAITMTLAGSGTALSWPMEFSRRSTCPAPPTPTPPESTPGATSWDRTRIPPACSTASWRKAFETRKQNGEKFGSVLTLTHCLETRLTNSVEDNAFHFLRAERSISAGSRNRQASSLCSPIHDIRVIRGRIRIYKLFCHTG